MSILSWFKSVTSGGEAGLLESEPLSFSAGEETFRGLNMKEALDAHTQWFHRLEAKINGTSNEQLDIHTVACDDQCKLGTWIHGEAKSQFGTLSSFDELRRVHADFHLTAGEVLNNVVNGDDVAARNELKKVRLKSGSVQLALVRLYSEAQ